MPSPTRVTRLQEKEDLSNLNDRLAVYIDKVRSLEAENAGLSERVRESESEVNHNLDRMRVNYEAKITEVRNALDSVNKDHARLQLDHGEAQGQYRDLKARYYE